MVIEEDKPHFQPTVSSAILKSKKVEKIGWKEFLPRGTWKVNQYHSFLTTWGANAPKRVYSCQTILFTSSSCHLDDKSSSRAVLRCAVLCRSCFCSCKGREGLIDLPRTSCTWTSKPSKQNPSSSRQANFFLICSTVSLLLAFFKRCLKSSELRHVLFFFNSWFRPSTNRPMPDHSYFRL